MIATLSTAPWGSRRVPVAGRFPHPATGTVFEHLFDMLQSNPIPPASVKSGDWWHGREKSRRGLMEMCSP